MIILKQIMGYYVANNLTTESNLVALEMAIKSRQEMDIPLIHHSERGLQYCVDYQKMLNKMLHNAE